MDIANVIKLSQKSMCLIELKSLVHELHE